MDRPGNLDNSALKLLGLMLALNLGVLVAGLVMQYWLAAEPAPMVYNAEKIQLLALATPFEREVVNPEQSEPLSDSSLQPESQLDSEAALDSNPVLPSSVTEQTSPETQAHARCLSWASLDPDQLLEIESHIRRIGITRGGYRIELEKPLGWWVFLPPHKNKAELDGVMERMRSLGISDFAPVRAGSMMNALSLGTFSALELAREHAANMISKGVKGVRYGPRPESGGARLILSETLSANTLQLVESGWSPAMQPTRCALPN
jgi:hypothetical protein